MKNATRFSLLNKQTAAWAVFDWGNSAISTLIFTFIFPVYFAASIVGDETAGSAQWGFAIALAGLATAIMAPLVGGMADHYGPRKPLLGVFSALTITAASLLVFAAPDPTWAIPALILAAGCTLFFELGQAVYNAMLSDMAPEQAQGRLSGIAWGMGYFGGLVCLVLALFGLVGLGAIDPWLALPADHDWAIRLTSPLAALWMGIFILPLFLFCKDRPRKQHSLQQAAFIGVGELKTTLKELWADKNLRFFIIGSAIYRDGLITLFAVGGLYAADQFGMSFTDILIFAIGLNITSGVGAIIFAFINDKIGSRQVILMSLIGLVLSGAYILFFAETKQVFMTAALTLGLFIGPAQSAGRVMMAQLSPADKQTQYFGLYAMTGKAVAFTGPLLYGLAITLTGQQNWGLAAILSLWIIGFVFIVLVQPKQTD